MDINMLFVTKRDGRKETVHFDKITDRINKLINPIELRGLNISYLDTSRETEYLDPGLVAQKVVASLYPGITTEELDIESAEICVNLSTTHPSYSLLGGRILISNLHKKTFKDFTSKMELLHQTTNIIDSKWLKWVLLNSQTINSIVDYNRDYLFDYFGFKTLEKSYLLKSNGKIIERPQDMFLRTAITLQLGNIELIKQTYDMMSLGFYTHASPTLFNSGTNHMQLSSCFLLGTNDDLTDIATTWNSCAQISKWSGGIGLHVSNIRAKNSLIKGTNGKSNGLVPFLRVFNDIARWIDQGGKRPGSIAIYLEPHHPDIFEFLDLRKNFGEENMRARDLFLSLLVSDLFMKQVEAGGDWYLLSADDCPGLTDTYGDDFEMLYWKYVNENKYRKKVDARKLWTAIMDSQIETGMPYICYKDAINKKCNQKNIGIIRSSNLCVHEETKILTSKGYQIIKSLENQNVNIWNGSEWSNVKVKKTGTNKNLVRVKLSNGAYLDCTPEHKFYTIKNYHSEKINEIMAKDLKKDDKLIKFELPKAIELENPEQFNYPYTHGFFCGDGTTYDNYSKTTKYPKTFLYGDKKKLLEHLTYSSVTESNNRLNVILPKDMASKFTVPFNASLHDKLRWLEGYSDADGSITKNGTNEALQICSINKEFLLDIRMMLQTMGIESKVTKSRNEGERLMPDGNGGNKMFECQKTYRLLVSSSGLYMLSKLGYKPKRLVFTERLPQRNAEQFVKVISVKQSYQNVDTYCFTEPLKHMGVFNGILTGQCAEITEYSDHQEYAVCNLASIALKSFVKPWNPSDKLSKWVIFTKPNCKYCSYAKKFLSNNKFEFDEIPFTNDSLSKLKTILGKSAITFPQIFIVEDGVQKHIGGWTELYQYTKGEFDYDKLFKVAYLATRNLNQVIDINYYPVPQTKLSNMKHRPIGLGIQGLADTLVMMKIPFESELAVQFNSKMMETIYLASLTASKDIAKERYLDMKQLIGLINHHKISYPDFYDPTLNLDNQESNELYHKLKPNKWELVKNTTSTTLGAYSTFDGSPFSEGKFQFDLWDNKVELTYGELWDELRKEVMIYGTRNSLVTALMPTASTSQILGNNECFEFFTNNIYTRKTQAGDFVLVNKYLVNDLISVGLWSNELKDMIIASNGSIQQLEQVPQQFKDIYKTIWEIKQVWSLKGAVARGPFVDQTQSMNIFMAEPDYQRLGSSHFWGWKQGLKTGMYYLRTKPSADAIKFTIDPNLTKNTNKINSPKNKVKLVHPEEDPNYTLGGCDNCSA